MRSIRCAVLLALASSAYAGVALAQQGAAPAATDDPKKPANLEGVTVVGDWLSEANQNVVANHPGARTVIRREDMREAGAVNLRDALRKVPGVQVQESNGTGGSDVSLNVGVRGLTSRLSPRSTLLLDGVPIAVAPYGQPQVSMAPVALGNLQAIDVVRGGGSVRYGMLLAGLAELASGKALGGGGSMPAIVFESLPQCLSSGRRNPPPSKTAPTARTPGAGATVRP